MKFDVTVIGLLFGQLSQMHWKVLNSNVDVGCSKQERGANVRYEKYS